MDKGIMSKYLLIITIFFSGLVLASQTEYADVHENYVSGSLPEPYGSFKVGVVLNESDHSISKIEIIVGSQAILVPEAKIKNIKNASQVINSSFIESQILKEHNFSLP